MAGSRIGMTRRGRAFALAAAVAVCFAGHLAGGDPASAGTSYVLEDLGDFQSPVHVDNAPGAPDLLFVVEQSGRIRVLDDGVEQAESFLDIGGRVAAGGEEGLLSVAFHPNYDENRRFFVFYTNRNEGHDIQVDQFKRRQGNPLRAKESSRRRVIVVQHNQANNHNGGQLQAGSGNRLFISIGDGGPQGDPENDAQRRNSLLGKILRIKPRPEGGYDVPAGNPYVGRAGRNEIYARGLRNPFRFSFDAETGALTIGDVGGGAQEEIDYEPDGGLGANFGWNDFEGFQETTFGTGDPPSRHEPPLHDYATLPPPMSGEAITGGYIVRDPDLPGLQGLYVYTDYFYGQLRTIDPEVGPASDADLPGANPGQFVSSFGEGADRQIYVVGHSEGDVFALEPAP
jgi:glucose/arabinose dehydrogenase